MYEKGYPRMWHAIKQSYDEKTRTFTGYFKLRYGFVDTDGNVAFQHTVVFDENITRSVNGTSWQSIGEAKNITKSVF